MTVNRYIEAIYEGGVFKPLEPVDLAEHERVRLTIEAAAVSEQQVEEMLELAFATYEGLTPEEIQQIEAARIDQEHFFRRPV